VTARTAWGRQPGMLRRLKRGFTVKMNQVLDLVDVPQGARGALRAFALAALCVLPLAGCGEGGLGGSLRRAGIAGQPDEFRVLPTRPLEMPPNLAALPPPAPGTTNRVAYRPQADAVAALSGQPAGPAARAPALVARVAAETGGVDPAIRARLADEDVVYRRENQPRLLERWFGRDRSRRVYSGMILDAEAELASLRAAGVQVPSAPPLVEE
jgi:hypothetical protein